VKKSKELSVAIKAAKAAAKVIMKYYGHVTNVRKKSDSLGIVTDADFEAQEVIKKEILSAFPKASFYAEEDESHEIDDSMWIVDPIDGTLNFSRGIKCFSVSIAFMRKNKLIVGLIFNPATDEMFYAEKGKGAFLNGKKIKVSKIKALDEMIFDIGLPKRNGVKKRNRAIFKRQFGKLGHFRHFGSAALQLVFIAAGWIDAFTETGLFAWDLAAGVLILQEAGGKVTDERGAKIDIFERGITVASNNMAHKEILRGLRGV